MRILVTGLGTFWGSKVAQRLEQEPGVELVVGVAGSGKTILGDEIERLHRATRLALARDRDVAVLHTLQQGVDFVLGEIVAH